MRYGFILALICLVASASLAVVNSLTRTKILAQAKLEEENSLKEVLPEGVNFEAVKSGEDTLYYKVYNKDSEFIGIAFKASGKGYSSDIQTMVGMKKDGTISAIKVLNQNETPGLGARVIEVSDDTTIWDVLRGKKGDREGKRPWFQEQFANKKIPDLKSIQAISAATISSKAVIDSVERKAQEFKELIKNDPFGSAQGHAERTEGESKHEK